MLQTTLATIFVTAAAALFLPGIGYAQNYRLLGEEIAKFERETDTFEIDRRAGPFDQIKIQSERASIELFRLRIIFGNGERRDVDRKRTVEVGRDGIIVDMRDRGRRISRVEATYRTIGGRGGRRAIVSLLGREGPRVIQQPGYRALKSVTSDLRNERIVIDIGRGAGRFDAIQLGVARRDVFVERIVIAFGNGDIQSRRLNRWIDQDSATRPIELERGRRTIREVTIVNRGSRTRDIARFTLYAKAAEQRRQPDTDRFGPRPRLSRGNQPIGYDRLGRIRTRPGSESERITVGRDAGRFSHLALGAVDNDAFIREIVVTYGSGKRDRIVVERQLLSGTVSPSIRLDGNRFIRFINLVVQSRPGRRPAILTVFGTGNDGARARPARKPEWITLGSGRPPRFKPRTDTFRVGRGKGRFTAFRMAVRRHDVRFKGITVFFDDGSAQDFPFYAKVKDGTTTTPFSLGGNPRGRFVRSIRVEYTTTVNFKGSAEVEFLGLRR